MVRTELVSRSPLRILEKSTHGGVGKGNIGVIAGIKGVGKTACLVHIATDDLFQGKHVIHVSFSKDASHIVAWYEDIFSGIVKRCKVEASTDVHDEAVKNRIILNFTQDGVHWPQVEARIRTMMENTLFQADAIIVDGFNFSRALVSELKSIRRFASDLGLEIWFSATTEEQTAGEDRMPLVLRPFLDEIAVVIVLIDKGSFIHLELLKDHDIDSCLDLHLKLDPQILLIDTEQADT